ncbi:MAG: hypothetical protein R3F61_14540 [Myxococcota bacterium]
MSEPTELELERAVDIAEHGLRVAREVFLQATREAAVLEGVGGLWARLTGQHAHRVDEATQTAATAREEMKKRSKQLEEARAALAALRRRNHEQMVEAQGGVEESLDPRTLDEARYAGMATGEAVAWRRLHLRIAVRQAVRELDRVLEVGATGPGDVRLQEVTARIDAAVERASDWVSMRDPGERTVLDLLLHVMRKVGDLPAPAATVARNDVVEVFEARGDLELLEGRLTELVQAAEGALGPSGGTEPA